MQSNKLHPHPADPIKLPAPLTSSSTPMEVATCRELAAIVRREILDQWHEDAVAVERAAAEGMGGDGRSRLAEVTDALQALDRLCEACEDEDGRGIA
jgi:hypothetical protein